MAEEKICPACGKPTAGYVPCPHCGVDPKTRLSIRVAAILCAVTLVIGAGYFVWHTSTIGPQPVLIASIDGWLNYASVWIEGTVTSGPGVSSTSISFEVQDASEESIEVKVYERPDSLKNKDKIPMVGDHILLFGMLRVYLDGSMEIRVNKAEDLQLTPAQPVETTIRDLRNAWPASRYNRVTLEGRITNLRPLTSAKIYTLEDNDSNTVEMYVHNGLMYAEDGELDVKLLQMISVTAGASEYSSRPQLALASYDDIEVIENGAPTPIEIENINENMCGEFVRVRGQIIFVEMVGESDSLEVEKRYLWLDNKDNPTIWMWDSFYKLLPDNVRKLLKRGTTAEFTGKVSTYGELQIEFTGPQEPSLTPGTYEPPFVENVATIGSDNVGELVTIQGEMVGSEGVAAGVGLPSNWKLTLQDNFGETIKIWISNTIYERIPENDLPAVGDNLRVVGKVAQSGGEIQVQPGLPSDVVRVG